MRHLVKTGSTAARRVQKLQEEPERFLATVQIGVTLMGTLASALGGVIAIERIKPVLGGIPVEFIQKAPNQSPWSSSSWLLRTLRLWPASWSRSPWRSAIPNRSLFFTAALIDALSRLFSVVLRVLTASNNFVLAFFRLRPPEESAFISEDEVKYLIREGRKRGVFEPSEEDLIHSVFKFTDTVVREVMVPRTDIAAVEADSDIDAILRTMNEKGFSRLPVYAGTIDNVVGVVYVKDILPLHVMDQPFSLESVLRKPYIVPPNKKVSVLLKEMRERRIHLVLVGDEYGGIDGLVTMEDLIERSWRHQGREGKGSSRKSRRSPGTATSSTARPISAR